MKIRNTILGAGLWAVAAGASALSLGGSRGSVVLGSSLDLSFDVQPDPGSDVASSCVVARVMSGDAAIGDAKVRVVPLPDMRGRSPAVRVQAAIAVDEPVVTVTLTAGCTGKVTRTYTFFAELPTAVARSGSPVDVSRLPAVGAAPAIEARPGQGAASPSGSAANTTSSVPPPASSLPAASRAGGASTTLPAARQPAARAAAAAPESTRPRTAPRPARNTAPGPSPADRARLVVEPLDLWLDRPVALRTSPELLVTPSDQASAQRAEAAALWKALNAQPDNPQQDGRLQSLEADVASLRAQAARDQASAAQLRQQLELAESERFPATLVYAMAGVLLLALLLVAWAWVRMRSTSEKALSAWRDSVAALGGRDALAQQEAALGLVPHPNDAWTSTGDVAADALLRDGATPRSTAPVPHFVDTAPAPSAPAPLRAAPVAAPVTAPVPVVRAAPAPTLHIVSPEELFDIQQQAEFFISVGEHQQAIEVLKKHIAERGDTSPLAYLELLRLYHSLSRVEEFSQLRTQFMQSFNALVPEFAGFHRAGRMLYHYTDALADIEAQWSSPAVLQVLEKMLFKQAGVSVVEPFDLAAYDDLLLLLAIAQTTPASARGTPPPRQRTTPMASARPDSVAQPEPAPREVLAATADLPLDSAHAALDFDFSEFFPGAAPQPPQPPTATAPPQASGDTGAVPLDVDLSEPPHLTLSDLPPVPVTAPPPPGHAVGFGMDNDLVELRLELEQKKSERS